MEIKELFELQKKLDDRIVKEKGLEGQDLLPEKILALQVELGELANEWRGFKFWSEDQEPRTRVFGLTPMGLRSPIDKPRNRVLEEYVDCLHFMLSISNQEIERCGELLSLRQLEIHAMKDETLTLQFLNLIEEVSLFADSVTGGIYTESSFEFINHWENAWSDFKGLGEMLGFTWEEVTQAYLEKNKINHERQINGY